MTTPINDGGPAFPLAGVFGTASGQTVHANPSMTLRDYFAAKAMQSLCSLSQEELEKAFGKYEQPTPAVLAAASYQMADEMIKARSAA